MKEKILKRILICLICSALTLGLVFGFYPNKTKAIPVSLIPVGAGAVAAIVGAYFASAGVSTNFNSGSNTNSVRDFFTNAWVNWIDSLGEPAPSYFDSDGKFIGTDDDAKLIANPDSDSYFVFGKEFTQTLEEFKDYFVDLYDLEVGTTTQITSSTNFIDGSGKKIPVLLSSYNLSLAQYEQAVSAFNISPSSNVGDSFRFSLGGTAIVISITSINPNYTSNVGSAALNVDVGGSSSSTSVTFNKTSVGDNKAIFTYDGTWLRLYNYRHTYGTSSVNAGTVIWQRVVEDLNTATISVTGELTDGYDDFEQALNQDLAQEADNADAAVGINIGNYDDIISSIGLTNELLWRILQGTLEGSYTGTYENQEEAEEDLNEDEQVVTPEFAPGFVVVNGLEDFFPFCIPFDLYEIIRFLNVPAEAPHFQWKMSFSGRVPDYMINIDLNPYNTVALVFRTMIIIIFLIFLTMKTRDLIRG